MITLLDPDSRVTFMHEPNLRRINSPIDLNLNIDYGGVRWKSMSIKVMYNVPPSVSVTQQWNYNCLLLEKIADSLFVMRYGF